MKAGDEVPAAGFTYVEFGEMYDSFTERQRDWLKDKCLYHTVDAVTAIYLFGIPSDAELQRREGWKR